MVDHDTLIDALCEEAAPVRRVAPAWHRALVWGPVALALGYLATNLVHRTATDWHAPLAGIAAANIGLSLALGLAAFAAALSISIAGGIARVKGWLLAILGGWLALSAYSIGISDQPAGHLGEGSYCFTFVVIAGIPMVAVAVLALRRTRSLRPVRSLGLAGMGIAFLSFGLLAFCHPVALSAVDFIGHLAAGLFLAGMTIAVGLKAVKA